MPNLPSYTFRPSTLADLPAVVAVLNAHTLATIGTTRTAGHWQHRHWYESGLKLSQDTRVAVNPAGEIVGYAELVPEAPYLIHLLTWAIHPDLPPAEAGQIAATLLDWADQRAQELLSLAPAAARVVIHNNLFEQQETAIALLKSHDFQLARSFVHLHMTMTEPPAEPVRPEGIEVRPLQPPGDWAKVGPALDEAFQDHWGTLQYPESEEEEDETELPDGHPDKIEKPVFDRDYRNSPGLCFIAWAGDEVAGSCLCNAKSLEWPNAGYLGSLSIRRPWRRQRLGLALTLQALGEFYRRGTRHIHTDTDSDGFTSAHALYQKAGMTIYRQENLYEKEIRPGRDYLKRTPGS